MGGRLLQRRVEPGCDTGIVGMPCHQVAEPLHLARHRVQRVERLAQHLPDGGPGVEAAVLGQVPEVAGSLDRAGIRQQGARDTGEQGRLAGPVLADEADPVPRRDGEVDAVEHGSAVEGDGQVADDDGGGRWHEGLHEGAGCSPGREASGASTVVGQLFMVRPSSPEGPTPRQRVCGATPAPARPWPAHGRGAPTAVPTAPPGDTSALSARRCPSRRRRPAAGSRGAGRSTP